MTERIIELLRERYPDLVNEIYTKYRAGIGSLVIWQKSNPDYDPLPEIVRVAAMAGYQAGQQDASDGRNILDDSEGEAE